MLGVIRSPSSRRRALAVPRGDATVLSIVGPGEHDGGVVARLGTLQQFLLDDLTELGSMLALRHDLELLIDRFQPFGVRPALLMIDIDGLARINSMYGRPAGDHVLLETARRMRNLAVQGRAYRTGGDEFVALLESTAMIDAVDWAQQVQRELDRPVPLDGGAVAVSVCVVVVMLGHRHRVDGLFRDADVAMYRAKAEGGNRIDVYNPEMDGWSAARKRDAERLAQEVEELRLQNRVLAEALTVDLDTGMPNALAFEADQQQADAWRKRSDEPYSVLRIRIDGIYDAGPWLRSPDGAAALTSVARAVRDTIRQSDRAYILDRGEFAVLLRGSVMKQAVMASERIRASAAGLALPHPADGAKRMTLTVAAVEAGFRHAGPVDIRSEAEHLLQEAVSSGGDRTVWPR